MHRYDLAISFAGEQRELADRIARRLDSAGYSIFYDRFARAELWGRDLTVALQEKYANEARFCLVLVSHDYVAKAWPNLERQNAITRFMRDRTDYLLCLRMDDAVLPGLPSTVAYLDWRQITEDALYNALLQKLGAPAHANTISHLSRGDRKLAEAVLQACYTRAIFTQMASEITLSAMYVSIETTLNKLQKMASAVKDQSLQHAVLMIIGTLDEIERTRRTIDRDIDFGLHLRSAERANIDSLKLEAIRLLLEIRRAADIQMHMPHVLGGGHFFSVGDADAPPDYWHGFDETREFE